MIALMILLANSVQTKIVTASGRIVFDINNMVISEQAKQLIHMSQPEFVATLIKANDIDDAILIQQLKLLDGHIINEEIPSFKKRLIFIAAEAGHEKICEYLLSKKEANLISESNTNSNDCPISLAYENGHRGLCKQLLNIFHQKYPKKELRNKVVNAHIGNLAKIFFEKCDLEMAELTNKFIGLQSNNEEHKLKLEPSIGLHRNH
jgi:hypothetical protein